MTRSRPSVPPAGAPYGWGARCCAPPRRASWRRPRCWPAPAGGAPDDGSTTSVLRPCDDVDVPDDCLFCRIVAGEIPAEVVASTDTAVAFRDVNPQAPLHVLVVPRTHLPDAASLAEAEPATVAALVGLARHVATDEGHEIYRLVFNTGAEAGQ